MISRIKESYKICSHFMQIFTGSDFAIVWNALKIKCLRFPCNAGRCICFAMRYRNKTLHDMVIVMVQKWYLIIQHRVGILSYLTVHVRYIMTNENKMIRYEILMLCYQILMVCYDMIMLYIYICYDIVYVVKYP